MSMLLEALKKSEEQRQLGSTPDIHQAADHNPDGERSKARTWLPLIMAALAVTVMAWFGWNQMRAPQGSVNQPATARAEPSAEQAGPAAPGGVPATRANAPRQPRTMVEQFAPANSGEAANPPPAQQQDQRRKDVSRSFNQFAAGEKEQERPVEARNATDSPPPGPVAAPVEPPGQRATTAVDSTPPDAAVSEPWEAGPMSYWALPQGIRDSLPEFRITVLVFADKPEDRFLLINGMRMKEKDELQSGVVLEEIRREGAVFRARNYRFLVRGG